MLTFFKVQKCCETSELFLGAKPASFTNLPVSFPGLKRPEVAFTIHPHPAPRLRLSRSISISLLYVHALLGEHLYLFTVKVVSDMIFPDALFTVRVCTQASVDRIRYLPKGSVCF
jgi:hypothetical protein